MHGEALRLVGAVLEVARRPGDPLSDDPWPLIIVAWAVTVAVLAGYAVLLVRRGRRMSRELPSGERRWL